MQNSWKNMLMLASVIACSAEPSTARASASVFQNIYGQGSWRSRRSHSSAATPASGGGSTLTATRTSCRVLQDAVRMVKEAGVRRGPIRIFDAPCGDFTWMPGCLARIQRELGVSLSYTGADIVAELVAQLNAGEGHLLVNGKRAELADGIRAKWIVLDQSDYDAVKELGKKSSYDVIVSKHMFIHLQSEVILRILAGWNQLGAQLLVTDDYATGANWNWLDADNAFPYREMSLREPPFSLGDPECSQPDAAFCEFTSTRCDSNINVWKLPLQHGEITNAPAASSNQTRYEHKPTIKERKSRGELGGRRFVFCHNLTGTEAGADFKTPRGQRLLRHYSPGFTKMYSLMGPAAAVPGPRPASPQRPSKQPAGQSRFIKPRGGS